MTIATPSNYWIDRYALRITLNALSNPDYILGSTTSGAVILCYIKDINGLGYDAGHNYRRWTLRAYPTAFTTHTPKYVYAAIPRTGDGEATICYPSELLDIYGKNSAEEQIGSTDYYYIYLQAIISSSGTDGTTPRQWLTPEGTTTTSSTINSGLLSTDEAIAASEADWWEYANGIVTFIKDITLKAGIKFLSLVTQTLNVLSTATIGGKLTVSSGGIDVTGGATIAGGATISGGASITGATAVADLNITGKTTIGTYNQGISGGKIDNQGDAELKSLTLRESLTVPKLVYNRTECVGGITWRCAGGGEIDTVTPGTNGTGTLTLKLEDGEAPMLAIGDICMGIYHLNANNDTTSYDGHNGNFKFAGFKTIYFQITGKETTIEGFDEDTRQVEEFTYQLRSGYTTHPQPHMNFAAYGNIGGTTGDTTRQTSELQTRDYTVLLQNVSSWTYGHNNIVLIMGKLSGFTIKTTNNADYQLSGTGIAFGNAYMWGSMTQIDRLVETFQAKLSVSAVQIATNEWYDADDPEEDTVEFDFDASIVTSQGTTVALTATDNLTLTPPAGFTLQHTKTLSDNTYHVHCTLKGYLAQQVAGVAASDNSIGVSIQTSATTVHANIALIESYQGKDGTDGTDGNGIELKGSLVKYYGSKTTFDANYTDIEEDGYYAVDGDAANDLYPYIIRLANYMKISEQKATKGDSWVSAQDGHLYTADDTSWKDCGNIKGADSYALNVSADQIIAHKDKEGTQTFNLNIQAFRGTEQILFKSDTSEASSLFNGTRITTGTGEEETWTGFTWNKSVSEDRKTLTYCLTYNPGHDADITLPYYITIDGLILRRNIHLATVSDGAEGAPGKRGTTFSIRKWSEVKVGDKFYTENEQQGILISDIVIDSQSKKWLCKKDHTIIADTATETETNLHLATAAPGEGSAYWTPFNQFNNVATDLLLAEKVVSEIIYALNARIDELIVKRLKAHDESDNMIASINQNDDGSLIQYYTGGGGKRLEIVDGTLYYYNVDGSLKWKLGEAAKIVSQNMQYYEDMYLYKMESAADTSIMTSNKLTGTLVKLYHSEIDATADGTYCKGTINEENIPIPADRIEDGYYTLALRPQQKPVPAESTYTYYFRKVLHIVSGKLVDTTTVEWQC